MARQVQILRESGAEAVICVGAYAACAAFVRDARNAGWNVPIANLSFVGSENLLALLQSTSRDYTANLYNSQVVPSYHNTDLPAVKRYRLMMDKHKPEVPDALRDESYHPLPSSFVSLEGYLDAELLIEILRRLGPEIGAKDRKRLPGVVESIKDFDLGIGPDRISFGPERHQGSDRVYFTEVRNGRFVSVGEDWGK
jgi:ABC-type branched-subunit amino acid transport system substrate-binding protein